MSDKIDNEYLAVCPTSGLDRLPFSIRSWHEFYKSCSKENLSIIVALEDKTSGIGFQNDIPWKIVEDQTFFRRMTLWRSQSSLVAAPMSKNAVIMGWKTWLSMKCKPLPDRVNMIVCSAERIQKEKLEATKDQQLLYASDFEIGLKQLWENPKVDRVFAIGGTRIYEAALDCPHLSDIYISRVKVCCVFYFSFLFFKTFHHSNYCSFLEQ